MDIPVIDVGPLFERPGRARDATDGAIFAAAAETGFMIVRGVPAAVPAGHEIRRELLRFFTLAEAEKRHLLRRNFDPAGIALYRGYFPLQDGGISYKEGIDIGPSLADAGWVPDPSDPLTEVTPLPDEAALPGWRHSAASYYVGMTHLGGVLMRGLARQLELPETFFDDAFRGGISTLRLIRYPERSAQSLAAADPARIFVEHQGRRRHLIGGAHVDSGFVTLLAQDGVEGLQAKASDGRWIDVPPLAETLAVNFGGLLERWTAGRIKATEHRVLGPGRERCSIPFFYEPRVDAVIRPLPGSADFAPFSYGDHLWAAMVKFIEFQDLKGARVPRGP